MDPQLSPPTIVPPQDYSLPKPTKKITTRIPVEKRRLYYAVKRGHRVGVFEKWEEAEEEIKGHPAPQWKTFKTYLAAEAFVAGTDGSGATFRVNHSTKHHSPSQTQNFQHIPSFTPPPTRSPPAPAPVPSPTRDLLRPPRPHFARNRTSSAAAPVRRSSPLRREVTEGEAEEVYSETGTTGTDEGSGSESDGSSFSSRNSGKEGGKFAGFGLGILSPPGSPEMKNHPVIVLPPPPFAVVRPGSPAAIIPGPVGGNRYQMEAGATSIPSSKSSSRISLVSNKSSTSQSSGLWGDSHSSSAPLSPPMSPSSPPNPAMDLLNIASSSAPAFSRRNMKKSTIPMPLPATKSSSSPSNSRPGSIISPKSSTGNLRESVSMGEFGLGKGKRASMPSLKSLKGLHEKLVGLSMSASVVERGGEDVGTPTTSSFLMGNGATGSTNLAPPTMPRSLAEMRSKSSSSVTSDGSYNSEDSFASARSHVPEESPGFGMSTIQEDEAVLAQRASLEWVNTTANGLTVQPPATSYLSPPISPTDKRTPIPQPGGSPDLLPLTSSTSAESTNDSHGSVATHTRSEGSVGSKGKKSGAKGVGLGRFFKGVFGLKDAAARRASH